MRDTTETHPGLKFESGQEEKAFYRWLESVAAELNPHSGLFDPKDDVVVTQLIDPEEGYLAPDGDRGFPNFYDYPYTDQVRADDLVYYLYNAAFEPDEKVDCDYGRTNASVLTYPNVYDVPRGEANCVGVLASRRPRHGDPAAKELPDALLFRSPYLYIGDFACRSEQDLLSLYRLIMGSRIHTPSPSPWERLKEFLGFGSS